MSETTIRPLPGSWAERGIARGRAYCKKVENGEIKPEEKTSEEQQSQDSRPRGFSIGFISAHIA